jgi:DNA-binding Xre family transcriptional regulator
MRAVRQRARLRQSDVAERAGVSQTNISRAERGRLRAMPLSTVRRLCDELEIELIVTARWRGADGVRLLDAAHAALVNAVVTRLEVLGWVVSAEYTYSEWGERGSVDVLGWLPAARALVIVEVKSVLVDSQDLLAGLDRKRRIVPGLVARDRRWAPRSIGQVLVAAATTGNRRSVARLASTFGVALPATTRDVLRWLRDPEENIAGVWFLATSHHATGNAPAPGTRRIRVKRRSRRDRAARVVRVHGSADPTRAASPRPAGPS